ncbi:MAG: hypothetical protein H0V34_05885 [Gammaproteobacteria bacterium]|nr:hypothetical protein [Gammaproteobacteria bacterium]
MQQRHGRTSIHNRLSAHGELFEACFTRRDANPATRLRSVQGLHNWRHLLGGVVLLLLLLGQPAYAATINVNERCTLVRAINAANTDTRARGVCKRGRGADRIVMRPHSRQILTRVHNTIFGPTGLPVIRSPIAIFGYGSTIMRRPGAPGFRIFAVAASGRLTLGRLNVRNGFAPKLGGGGIRSLGALTMTKVAFNGNRALGSGGGFWAQNIVTVTNSTFAGNRGFCPPTLVPVICNGGAGFYSTGQVFGGQIAPAALTVNTSTFTANAAGGQGGGMQVNGAATVNDSTLADNVAQQGGAMAVGTALANVINDALSAAKTVQRTWAAAASAPMASVEITNTTLTDNVATRSGGGLVVGDGSDLTLNNTVISGNTAPRGREAVAQAGSFVEVDNANTIGFGGSAGVVGFAPGQTDDIAPRPPTDPTPGAPPPPVGALAPPTPPAEPPPPRVAPAPSPMPPPPDSVPLPAPLIPRDPVSPPGPPSPPDPGPPPNDGPPANNGPSPGDGTPSDNAPPSGGGGGTPDNGPPPDNEPPLNDDGPSNNPPLGNGSPDPPDAPELPGAPPPDNMSAPDGGAAA